MSVGIDPISFGAIVIGLRNALCRSMPIDCPVDTVGIVALADKSLNLMGFVSSLSSSAVSRSL